MREPMRHPRRTLAASIVLGAVLCAVAFVTLYRVSVRHLTLHLDQTDQLRRESIRESLDIYFQEEQDTSAESNRTQQVSAELNAAAIRPMFIDGTFHGSQLPENSFILEDSGNGTYSLPEGMESLGGESDVLAQIKEDGYAYVYTSPPLTEEEGSAILHAVRLTGSSYYVEWTPMELYNDQVESQLSFSEFCKSLEGVFSGDLLVLFRMEDTSFFYYTSPAFEKYDTPEDLPFSLRILDNESGDLEIDGKPYRYSTIYDDESSAYFLFLTDTSGIRAQALEQSGVIVFLTALFMLVIIILNLAVQQFVRDHILSSLQKKKYAPASLRKTNCVLLILGVITVLAASIFVQSMGSLYLDISGSRNVLSIVQSRLESKNARNEDYLSTVKERYLDYAEKVSVVLQRYPSYAAQGGLKRMNRIIDGQFLILFDENGNEIASSGDYRGLTLRHLDGPDGDFERIRMGGPGVFRDAEYNQTTGLNSCLAAVRYVPQDSEGYGVLVLGISPKALSEGQQIESIDNILSSLTFSDDLLLEADTATGTITHASSSGFIGREIASMGLKEQALQDGSIDHYTIDGKPYYGMTQEWNGHSYLSMTSLDTLSPHSLRFILAAVLAFLLSALLMAYLTLRGYDDAFFNANAEVGVNMITGTRIEVVLPNGSRKVSIDPSGRWLGGFRKWSMLLPEQKVRLVIEVLLGLFIVLALLNIMTGSGTGAGSSMLSYVVQGQWSRGFSIFSAAAVLLMTATILVALFLLDALFSLICSLMGTKGETIMRLIMSLIKYVGGIMILYYAFGFLGFDTAGLLASVGFVTLAISLGARDLVTDILAGLTIVFDGDFQVGDIVDIAGYRGKVLEIGVRSIKLIGTGDNIKVISNRDVRNVINMTQLNSWYPLNLTIPSTVPLSQLEEVFERELPKIGEQIPEIISGPSYKGVTQITGGKMTVNILAEHKEEDYFRVQRQLTSAVLDVLAKEGIPTA